MKLIRYQAHDGPRWGILDGETIRALEGELWGEMRAGPPPDRTGLDPRTQLPFLRLLAAAVEDDEAAPLLEELARATVEMVDLIREEIGRVDFWRNRVAQDDLRSQLINYLDYRYLVPFDRQEALADQLVQLAHEHHLRLVQPCD